jgi:putative transposase
MGSFFLQQGLVISRRGQLLEYSSRAGKEFYFEEPTTGKRVTIEEPTFWGELQTGRLRIADAFSSPKELVVPEEPFEDQFRNLADLSDKAYDDVERKNKYISRLREMGITQGQTRYIDDAVKRISEEIEDPWGVPGTSTVQKWWRDLARNNYEVYALISGHAQRKSGVRLDDESEAFLQDQIDDKYAKKGRPTAAGAYRGYEDAIKLKNVERSAAGLPPLTAVAERTFYARIADRPQYDLMVARLGREAARRHFKMSKGHLPAAHPLDVVEIDHTPLNLYVIDDLSHIPLGRPWCTAIKDRYSGVLLGFYLSFQQTGLDSIFGAIKHSLSSHHLAYELWPDIENPWPFGRAHYYASDRGRDFLSANYRRAITSLGSWYHYCERRTPWLKGSIERFFLTLDQTFFEVMEGRTFANLSMRGDYKPEKDCVIRFSTLVYLMHKWAADFHNVFVNKRKQAKPLDLYSDGIVEAPPPYFGNADQLNIILGNHYSGVLSQEGIRFEWLTYANDELEDLMELVGKGGEVSYVIPGEDLGCAYVRHPKDSHYIQVPCTRPDYASGLSLFQHKYLRNEAAVRLEKDTAVDTLVATRARIADVVQEELAARQTAQKSRLARVAEINSNSVLCGTPKSVTSPFGDCASAQQETQASIAPAQSVIPSAPMTNVRRPSWGA